MASFDNAILRRYYRGNLNIYLRQPEYFPKMIFSL